MIYKLVLKDYCTKVDSDEKDFNERFYRYDIVDLEGNRYATVWFGQMVNSKNIYTVSVSLDMKYNEKFNLYITCPRDEYYPKEYEVVSYQDRYYNYADVDEHCKLLKEVYEIGRTIMSIFADADSEHRKETKL